MQWPPELWPACLTACSALWPACLTACSVAWMGFTGLQLLQWQTAAGGKACSCFSGRPLPEAGPAARAGRLPQSWSHISAASTNSRPGTSRRCTAPCRRMWALLQLHAKQCQTSDCPVPCCRQREKCQMSRQKEEQRQGAYQAVLQLQHRHLANSPHALSERNPVTSELPAQVSQGEPASMALHKVAAYRGLSWLYCQEDAFPPDPC